MVGSKNGGEQGKSCHQLLRFNVSENFWPILEPKIGFPLFLKIVDSKTVCNSDLVP